MKTMMTKGWILGLLALFPLAVWAQTGPMNDALAKAQAAIDPANRNKVMVVFAKGSATAIEKWYFVFWDAKAASHGRMVTVEDGAIEKVQPVTSDHQYLSSHAFDPSASGIPDVSSALSTAAAYANDHQIAYDGTKSLLRRVNADAPPAWKVELLEGGASRGYVYCDAQTAGFVRYESAAKHLHKNATDFADGVEKTFKGIGGDLQEFFTGERTVDK